MKRRELITLLGGAAAWPIAVRAQPAGAMRLVGVLMGTSEGDSDQRAMTSAFSQGLAALGWRERSTIRIEYRWAAGDASRLRVLATELARLAPDAIFAQGTPATTAARQAAPTTPVVFVNVSDPVSTGLVSSLAHPGGNITGFTNYDFAMGGKWLEILKQVAPSIMRVAVVFNPDNPGMSGQLRSIDTAGQSLGIQVVTRPARDAEEIERAIDGSAAEASGSLLILLDFVTLAHREQIIKFANQHRLPAGYGLRVFAADGGLFSYGVDASDLFRRGAGYVDRILKGEKPADLPVQYPIKFELVINLKTAKAMGLVIPESVLAVADEVIE
jgi:putative ABC transport system substrate-binding protein